ncbi:hypothetical protein N7532_000521 [Penicillium argentinense]|uniref:Uncharacterized protein n=1 Tax=Penicillium argentinense TaxID=1131581 RepID=A0A9W9G5P3_9EURO|nr:uncharacterized protein N7532_000521 [Penicillium argentinense]KAJ5112476.1 hypothetical protein N7532_000521 [Penicillium argentinense]
MRNANPESTLRLLRLFGLVDSQEFDASTVGDLHPSLLLRPAASVTACKGLQKDVNALIGAGEKRITLLRRYLLFTSKSRGGISVFSSLFLE